LSFRASDKIVQQSFIGQFLSILKVLKNCQNHNGLLNILIWYSINIYVFQNMYSGICLKWSLMMWSLRKCDQINPHWPSPKSSNIKVLIYCNHYLWLCGKIYLYKCNLTYKNSVFLFIYQKPTKNNVCNVY
jgi:hypothetical protein